MAKPTLPNSRLSTISSGGAAAAGGMRFQAQLGVFFGLGILNQRPIDHVLGLGEVVSRWMRFESEAPVDDLLVATSAEGFVAVQAKTSVNLSSAPEGGLYKTVQQFVQHWLVCRDGDGSLAWNRPLDPERDRLVLAVGPNAPATIRIHLPDALRLKRQPGHASLTQDQVHALRTFELCTERAWSETTADPWDPNFINELARFVIVWTFDPDGADARYMETVAESIAASAQSRVLLTALLSLCDRWITERGGADSPMLRKALMQERVTLTAPRLFADDIRVLQEHSSEIAQALEPDESIDRPAGNIHVARECQSSILAAAEQQSILLIGEPGAGKSAILNALARELRKKGDVVELAVDRYNIEDLDGLRIELGLQNSLVKVLEAWDGPTDAWLIIDALDATRGGRGEGAFRSLIERILGLKGRWKVVASIRTFDLRMGVRFRELFAGQPPNADYRDSTFANVRHLLVRPWSQSEFSAVLAQAPELSAALMNAPAKLRHLAEVPFNTRLIYELLRSGVESVSLQDLSSQAQLLRLFWDRRVVALGVAAEACLGRVVQSMLDNRTLRTTTASIGAIDPSAFDELCRGGVLTRVENDRYIQFRHHLLFDYVASRMLLDPDAIISGKLKFPKAEAKGLMLAPALGFLLQELWLNDADRNRYWSAVVRILGDKEGDPVLRSAAGRLSSELPAEAGDLLTLARHIATNDSNVRVALEQVVAALAVRFEDDPDVLYLPWVALAGLMSENVERVANVLRFLTHLLINAARPPQLSEDIGKSARALLRDCFKRDEAGTRAASLIPLVVATFETNPTDSVAILGEAFEPKRISAHGWEDVPALCREIKRVAPAAPKFAVEVYSKTYAWNINSDTKTRIGDSKILPLTSNARQDYGTALYSLSEYFPDFLSNHSEDAVEALVGAIDAFVSREHAGSAAEEGGLATVSIGERMLRLKPDGSHIWAHDPDSQYGQDGEALIQKFTTTLIALPEVKALSVANYMLPRIESAILWARLFLAAVRRQDGLVDVLWPIAASGPWLMLHDTRKDAIDVVAAGFARRSIAEKRELEQLALAVDMSDYKHPLDAKEAFLRRLFGAIGADQLVTNEARSHVTANPKNDQENNNRLFRVEVGSVRAGTFDWIPNLERTLPSNVSMIAAIEGARDYLGRPGQSPKPDVETSKVFDVLAPIVPCLSFTDLDPELRRMGEGTIGEACALLANGQGLVAANSENDPTERFLNFLRIAVESDFPIVDDDTEADFEKSPGWGTPAPRVEAAEAVLDVCLYRPDLYDRLNVDIDRLLDDKHPATRLQAASNLVRIWDLDREAFWDRLDTRFRKETNFGVLGNLIDLLRRVLHADPARTESQLIRALSRFDGTASHARITEMTADVIAILAISYSSEVAETMLSGWIEDPVAHIGPVRKVVSTLREALALGLRSGEQEDRSVRQSAQAMLHRIVLSSNRVLSTYDPRTEVSKERLEEFRECMNLLDSACMGLFFAIGKADKESGGLSDVACATFFDETAKTIERIGDYASPHTVYYLMQLIEILAPYDAARAFDITAHAIVAGGAQGGYQFESLGADLMVRLVGNFLADNKEIFESDVRRKALVDCLELFMEAGWTAARRLLYRLPELIQ